MKKSYIIKKAGKKGKGVFAAKDIKKGSLIMTRDYTKLKRYDVGDKRLAKSNHVDYVGNKKYVIDNSPHSYINHSCNPNLKNKKISKNITKSYATMNIKRGDEITSDYSKSKSAIEKARNRGIYIWKMKCKCGSKSCKKIIRGF